MRGEARSRRIAAPVVVALLALAAAAPAAHADLLARCATAGNDPTLCGRLTVPLDRGGVVPGSIRLRVRALPPTRGGKPTATVLALAGGPGQAATPLLDSFAAVLAPALRSRQLVTFDQRGTGGSGRIACPALARAGEAVAAVGQCASELGAGRVAYTTTESVADLEAVRAALGVERLMLYGTSYGTKLAIAYAAAYPQHVERLVLDSVVQPEGVDPFVRTTLASIPRILRALCAHGCSFTRDPVADLAALVRRLAHAPLRGKSLDGSGHPRPVSLTRVDLLELVLGGDFDRHLRAALPAAVRAVLDGDPAPLLRLAARGVPGDEATSGDSDAVFVATTCEDGGVPWPPGTPLEQRRAATNAAAAAVPAAAFAPFDRATVRAVGTADLCRRWPEAPIVQPALALPGTPALILSGDDDLRTPRADATALMRRLSGAQLLRVPDAGHGVLFADPTDCAQAAVVAFLAGKVPGGCRPHPRTAATLALPPQDLAAVAPVGGMPAETGRVLRVVLDTLDDATEQIVARIGVGASTEHAAFGGLRAGSATVAASGLRLRGYSYVPGIALDGRIPSKARRFTLKVRGKPAARGQVTVSAEGVVGRLGGKPVDVGAKALGWTTAKAATATPAPASPRVLGPVLWLPSGHTPDR